MPLQTLTIIDSNHGQYVFYPELTTTQGGGMHYNTEWIWYSDQNYLKCSHLRGNLQGVYKSPIFDTLAAADRYLVYIVGQDTDEFDIVVVGTGTTWDSQVPIVTTGADLLTDGAFDDWTLDDPNEWGENRCDASEDGAGHVGSAAKVTCTDALGDGQINQEVVTTPGKKYLFKGYYKNTAGDTALYRVYDVTNGDFITPAGITAYNFVRLPDKTSFSEFTVIFEAPAGCISAQIALGAETNGDIVWFDTVSVYEIDEVNSATWNSIGVATNTWTNIFELDHGPSVTMGLYYGATSPPTSYVDKMEILSAIVTARYFQVQININDPVGEVYAYVEEFYLRLCQ